MDPENSSPASYKNRKAGLVIFGILTILGGCLCLLFALFAAMAPMLAARSPNPPPAPIYPWPGVAMYGCLAIALFWLGIGSTMARRWARTLLAVLSRSFFVCGLFSLIILATMAPHIKAMMAALPPPPNQAPLPESAQMGVLIGMFLVCVLVTVIGPLIWALFYSGRNVKATCDALDPVPRWTDRCPAPVLAVSLWLFRRPLHFDDVDLLPSRALVRLTAQW